MNKIKIFSIIFERLHNLRYRFFDSRLVPSRGQNKRAAQIRKKEKIKVAFIINDIAKWRTESLYLEMLRTPRFEVVLVPVISYSRLDDYEVICQHYFDCIKYLKGKGYSYVSGRWNLSIDELVNPDFVFYGEHYNSLFDDGYTYKLGTKRKSLGCYVPYSMHNTILPTTNNQEQSNLVWMTFIENQQSKDDIKNVAYNKCKNKVVTGIPLQDAFLIENKTFNDAWKHQKEKKKRIIWAPSHTIQAPGVINAYQQSTFLEIANLMIELVEKYKDCIQWSFKPHPSLKRKLIQLWGAEKTNSYYRFWSEGECTQLDEGQYVDLFMTSDGMIHDCMSFMVEYMFTGRPIMFLDNGNELRSIYNTQTKKAYDLHYKGSCIEDVENFIMSAILSEEDSLKEARVNFKKEFLLPPNDKTASQNIINALLGECEYRM